MFEQRYKKMAVELDAGHIMQAVDINCILAGGVKIP